MKIRKTFTVNPEIIKEFPRFFTGGFPSVIKEILQNCYRSGSTEVTVHYDQRIGHLKVVDNGYGCKANDIITAGESGWNNADFDAAGLGVFSYFSVARQIVMISQGKHNWKMGLDHDNLNKNKEISIEDIKSTLLPRGFALHLLLDVNDHGDFPKSDSIKNAFANAKAYYPFRLYWNPGDAKLEELTYSTWEPEVIIESKIGVIYIKKDIYGKQHSIVHQHVPIRSITLESALIEYCHQHLEKDLLLFFLSNVNLRLFPINEVKPKLPDRDEFDSKEIQQIVPKIVDAIISEVDKISSITSAWPDIINLYACRSLLKDTRFENISNHYHQGTLMQSLLLHFGYNRIDYNEINESNQFYDEDNELRFEQNHNTVFIRNQKLLESPSQSVVDTLNNLGYFCKHNSQAAPILKLKGIHIPEENKHMGFSEEISIEGIGDIPYLSTAGATFKEYPEFREISFLVNPRIVTQEYLKTHEDLFEKLVCIGIEYYEGSFWEYQRERYGELELDTTAIKAELWADYYRENPELFSQVADQYDIEAVRFALDNLNSDISGLKFIPAVEKLLPNLANTLLQIINQSTEQIQNT